jgi:membrane-bound lytic murein transglycosylase D
VQDTGTLASDSATAAFETEAVKTPQVQLNSAAVEFVQEYLKKNSEGLQKVEERSKPVFRIMEPILAKYNLPLELKYLAVVESDLKRTAVSRVGAAGPWQLMPATARELGLKVTKKWDERKQYHQSTTAAARYLRDLYKVYEDWLLVIAAYNAGTGVINKAIRRAGSRNFWKLQYFLPAETRGHVKRFIGTHYYFEETGGETTLTKAENTAYAKKLTQFIASQQPEGVAERFAKAIMPANRVTEVLQEPAIEIVLVTKNK